MTCPDCGKTVTLTVIHFAASEYATEYRLDNMNPSQEPCDTCRDYQLKPEIVIEGSGWKQ